MGKNTPVCFARVIILVCFMAASTASAAENPARPPVQVPAEVSAVAPPGSCAADPTAERCPPVKRIVSVEEQADDGSTSFAPLPDDEKASASRRRARRKVTAAQAVGFACAVQSWDPVKLFHPGGDAFIRASGANDCRAGVGVTYQELYVSLQRWLNDRWENLATNRAVRYGSGRISEIAGFNCHHERLIAYRTEAFAYAVVNGVGYTGTDRAYQNHTCWP